MLQNTLTSLLEPAVRQHDIARTAIPINRTSALQPGQSGFEHKANRPAPVIEDKVLSHFKLQRLYMDFDPISALKKLTIAGIRWLNVESVFQSKCCDKDLKNMKFYSYIVSCVSCKESAVQLKPTHIWHICKPQHTKLTLQLAKEPNLTNPQWKLIWYE